jgi:hypothetical protein
MNGYEKQSLEEDNFGAKGSVVSAFDAFREFPTQPKCQRLPLMQ